MSDTCCNDALNADLRALARACRTAARLPAQGERARTVREAGEESTSASPEYDTLIESVAMLAEAKAGARAGGGSAGNAGPLPGNPLVLFGGIGAAIMLALLGIFMPGATPALPLPVDLVRTADIETLNQMVIDQAVIIATLEASVEGVRSDVNVIVSLAEEAVTESSRIEAIVEDDIIGLVEDNADGVESNADGVETNADRIQNLTIQMASLPR